jgi:iron complex outermembrane receptor protein
MIRYSSLIATSVAAACSLANVVYAQAPTSTGAKPEDTGGLEEIVVTAQRVEETAQRAAIAVSVLQPEALVNVTNPSQLTNLVPALQFADATSTSPLLYVRGVGTFAGNPYTDSAVAVNYDGVYLGRPTSTQGLFYDVERIEVLKGPQGTLYGRNATGGALNVLPARPVIGATSFSGSVDFGNYASRNGQAAVNIGLSDQTALRLAGIFYEHDGYNTDGTFSDEGKGARAQFLFEPSASLSVRLSGDYFRVGGTGSASVLTGRVDPATRQTVRIESDGEVGLYDPRTVALLNSPLAFVASAGAPFGALAARPDRDNEYYGAAVELNADLGWAHLTVLPAWRRAKIDTLGMLGTSLIVQDETDEQISGEVRLNGEAGAFEWLAGGFLYQEDVNSAFSPNVSIFASSQSFEASNNSYAGFGRLTWNVTDTFRLSGAARYTQDKKTFRGISFNAPAICTTPAVPPSPLHLCPNIRRLPANTLDLRAALASIGYIQPPGAPVFIDATGTSNVIWAPTTIQVNESIEPDKVTYRAAVEFDVAEASLLYASFETGYRSGGFSFSSITPTYQPETIDAFTLGAKNRFLNGRVQLNVEAFLWKYKDQQLAHAALGLGGGLEFVTENIGESTNQGVEIELMARPVPNTILRADVQYLDAKNDDFVYRDVDQGVLAGLPPGFVLPDTTCPATSDPTNGAYRIDCSNLRALRSPQWTLNLGVQQTIPVGSAFQFVLDGNAHYQTESITMFERRALGTTPEYWITNAAVSFGPKEERWGISLYINNISDERVDAAATYLPFGSLTSGNYTPPRTYGARFNFKL